MDKGNYIRHIIAIVMAGCCVVLFQNCADDFNPDQYSEQSSSSSSTSGSDDSGDLSDSSTDNSGSSGSSTTAPKLISKSPDTNVNYQQSFSLSVNASGSDLSYQWYKDDSILSGMNSPALQVDDADVSDSGKYSVVVANSAGSIQADINVVVTRQSNQYAPTITTAVKSYTTYRVKAYWNPSDITFSVGATNASSYQWYFKASGTTSFTKIIGATGSSYYIDMNKDPSNGVNKFGTYKVTVTNSYGSVSSQGTLGYPN